MGCSSSVVSPEGEVKVNGSPDKKNNNNTDQKQPPNKGYQNGHVKASQTNGLDQRKKLSIDKNANKLNPLAQAPVPKSVAFDITLDGQSGDGLLNTVTKRPPRLQTLEPLNLPKLTAEQLAEKQRIADEKRERIKQKKINTSQKSSKRRRELLKAREFGMKQQVEQEKMVIDDNLKQAEIKREQRLLEIKEKQKIREERARRARERAKRLQNTEDLEVEKDEEFNAASDDSWLGNPEPQNVGSNDAEEDEHLKKRVGQVRPTVSASTVDSYDAAFMRERHSNPQPVSSKSTANNELNDDDFFGS